MFWKCTSIGLPLWNTEFLQDRSFVLLDTGNFSLPFTSVSNREALTFHLKEPKVNGKTGGFYTLACDMRPQQTE